MHFCKAAVDEAEGEDGFNADSLRVAPLPASILTQPMKATDGP